jgi:hypothetical protein
MNPSRDELLQVIAEISRVAPELRLGQMIANLAMKARGPNVEGIWDCEDEELLPAARRLLEFHRNRAAEPVPATAE